MKAFHSAAFLTIQSSILFLIFKGYKRQTDRAVLIASGIAGAETLIYVGNGFRCPLTSLAEDRGTAHGAVTDIFLPKWLASNIDRIYGPLFGLGLFLHAANLLARRQAARQDRSPEKIP